MGLHMRNMARLGYENLVNFGTTVQQGVWVLPNESASICRYVRVCVSESVMNGGQVELNGEALSDHLMLIAMITALWAL